MRIYFFLKKNLFLHKFLRNTFLINFFLPSFLINFLNCVIKSFLNNSSVFCKSFLNFEFLGKRLYLIVNILFRFNSKLNKTISIVCKVSRNSHLLPIKNQVFHDLNVVYKLPNNNLKFQFRP